VTRHTFGSLLIQQGESLTYVKEQMGHASIQITVDIYGHLVPGGNRAAVDRLDSDASVRIPHASEASRMVVAVGAKSFVFSGEPGGNRTPNPQIKSLLLCQLSYRPYERSIVVHLLLRAYRQQVICTHEPLLDPRVRQR